MTETRKQVYVAGSGWIYAISTETGTIDWELELKSGWVKTGSGFVSLQEDGPFLYAFSYGIFYKINKLNGEVLIRSPEIKTLKHSAAIFAFQPHGSAGAEAAAAADSSDGGGDGGD